MTGVSLFDMYRWMLAITVCSYVVVRTAMLIWGWCAAAAGAERREALLRRYLVMVLLRVRAGRFWFELLQVGGLICVLAYVVYLHAA